LYVIENVPEIIGRKSENQSTILAPVEHKLDIPIQEVKGKHQMLSADWQIHPTLSSAASDIVTDQRTESDHKNKTPTKINVGPNSGEEANEQRSTRLGDNETGNQNIAYHSKENILNIGLTPIPEGVLSEDSETSGEVMVDAGEVNQTVDPGIDVDQEVGSSEENDKKLKEELTSSEIFKNVPLKEALDQSTNTSSDVMVHTNTNSGSGDIVVHSNTSSGSGGAVVHTNTSSGSGGAMVHTNTSNGSGDTVVHTNTSSDTMVHTNTNSGSGDTMVHTNTNSGSDGTMVHSRNMMPEIPEVVTPLENSESDFKKVTYYSETSLAFKGATQDRKKRRRLFERQLRIVHGKQGRGQTEQRGRTEKGPVDVGENSSLLHGRIKMDTPTEIVAEKYHKANMDTSHQRHVTSPKCMLNF
jgi:hypothetical protein